MSHQTDILAFGAHPDDVEMSCGGTLIKAVEEGSSVVIVDLTSGELGTRGTPELRREEAKSAGEVIGIKSREFLGLRDGMIGESPEEIEKVIVAIRKYRPKTILACAMHDRHPDHGRTAELIERAWFLAGLKKYEVPSQNEPWRAKVVYHYIQDRFIEPDFVVDISKQYQKRSEAIACYKSQFFDPNSSEEETYISSKKFQTYLEARAVAMGQRIGAQYGEGFTSKRKVGVSSLNNLI